MPSKTYTKDWEEEIDSESFIEASESKTTQSQKMEGVVLLKEAEFADHISELPASYRAVLDYEEGTDYLVFIGEDVNTGEEVNVVVRDGDDYNDLDMLKQWTGRDSISSLAGQTIPVQSTGFESDYMFPTFDFEFADDIDDIKEAYEMGAIEYKDGKWVKSEKMIRQEEFLDQVGSYAGSGFWFTLALSIFLPFEILSSILLFTSISLYVADWYSGKRQKPIGYLMERY